MKNLFNRSFFSALFSVCIFAFSALSYADTFLPGTGHEVTDVNDNFEDPKWEYIPNAPKSSYDDNKVDNLPGGISRNQKVFEPRKRGQPDSVRRVPTPTGGPTGSTGALGIMTLEPGIPGQPSNKMMQDDLSLKGRSIPVSQYPSTIVSVRIPDFDKFGQYEQIFGIRTATTIHPLPKPKPEQPRGRGRRLKEPEQEFETMYYPGFFIRYMPGQKVAQIEVRGSDKGQDVTHFVIKEGGWYTFGMSFTPDSQVHYYVMKGVGDFGPQHYVVSYHPYFGNRSRILTVENIFFDITSFYDGKTWSSEWIIDDPKTFIK